MILSIEAHKIFKSKNVFYSFSPTGLHVPEVIILLSGNFKSYVESVTALMPWMFAFDHINYARWHSIHVRDMTTPQTSHPPVYEKFASGAFAVRKSAHVFSPIAMDHAHKQERMKVAPF